MSSVIVDHWRIDREAMFKKGRELGVEIIERSANDDTAAQIRQIRDLITQGIKTLIIIPNDKDKLSAVVKEAQKKGIRVIAYERMIKNAGADLYVSYDGVKIGEYMAKELLKKVPEGNIVIINGSPNDQNSTLYNAGYKNVLKKSIESNKISIVKEVWAPGWRDSEAYKLMDELLSKGVKIDGVIASNDRLAEAAIIALTEHGRAGEVSVVGNDADFSACQRIMEGTQTATVYKPYAKLAELTIENAVMLAQNKAPNATDRTSDGTYFIDMVKLTDRIMPVTKDNMEETVVKEGFYSINELNINNSINR